MTPLLIIVQHQVWKLFTLLGLKIKKNHVATFIQAWYPQASEPFFSVRR
jgi:hypothetical protein